MRLEITNLVTSPFGIGEKLILELLKRGETVYTIFPSPKDVPMALLGKVHLKYGFIKFDQEINIEKGLPKNAVNVYHIYDIYSGPFTRLFLANTMATLFLFEWAKKVGVSKFIFLSSGEVYGQGKNLDENTPYSPKSFYATTKFHAETLSRYYSRNYEIKTLRIFFPFGKGLNQGYIHNLARAITSGGSIETEYSIICPTFVDDLIEPMMKVRDIEGNAIFNLCGSSLSVAAVIKEIEKISRKSASKIATGKMELSGNNLRAKELLAYKETPLEIALKNTI